MYKITGTLKNLYVYLTIVFVIFTYAFFAYTSNSREDETFSKLPYGRYQYLTESFLHGHTHLSMPIPAEYLELANPYDFQQFRSIKLYDGTYLKNRLYDVSFYKGKFHLYFGPAPVIFFSLPFKLITGFYPVTALVVFVFLSFGFFMQSLLLLRIKEDYFNGLSHWQLVLSVLIIGFSWPLLFTVANGSYLEAPIASAYCLMNLALFYLYKIFKNNFQNWDLVIFSLFLSLSVAGRPHFGLVCLFLYPLLLFKIYKNPYKNKKMLAGFFLVFPAIFVGSFLASYNYLRFDSIFEFGQKYQIPGSDAHGLYLGLFQLKNIFSNIELGLYNYFIRPFSVYSLIPYMDTFYEAHIARNYYFYDYSAGLFITNPFIVCGFLFPFMIKFYFKNKNYSSFQPLVWFLLFLSLIMMIIVGFVLSISFGSPRYEIDFAPYLIMLSMISLWLSKNYLTARIFKIVKLFYVLTGILSIYIGFWIGACSKPLNKSNINVHFLQDVYAINLNLIILYFLLIILLFAIGPRIRKSFSSS